MLIIAEHVWKRNNQRKDSRNQMPDIFLPETCIIIDDTSDIQIGHGPNQISEMSEIYIKYTNQKNGGRSVNDKIAEGIEAEKQKE